MKVKTLIYFLVINLSILLLGIIGLELIFGNWLFENRVNRLNIIKSCKRVYDVTNVYDRKDKMITYTRDDYGLRGVFNFPREIDILTVGGSTTDQRFIPDGETWQDFIMQAFQKDGKQIVVANAGVDGQSTKGYLKNFEWWFPHIKSLHPKYIIFYLGANDILAWDNSLTSSYDDLKLMEPQKYDNLPFSYKVYKIIRDKSAIMHLKRIIFGTYKAVFVQKVSHRRLDFDKQKWTTKALQNDHQELMAPHLLVYKKRLEKLIQHSQKMGAKPVFVTTPIRQYRFSGDSLYGVTNSAYYRGETVNGVDLYYMMMEMNKTTLQTCAKNDCVPIDVCNLYENKRENDDFYDLWHMTPKGAKKVGQLVFEGLQEQF
ncbi:MAG: SGNH/GDSL hydrolase family protein [Fibrobacteria bacterium]|nr:SGNH/GDSL hydrolase family protein [Fibrobacteria bacterium]